MNKIRVILQLSTIIATAGLPLQQSASAAPIFRSNENGSGLLRVSGQGDENVDHVYVRISDNGHFHIQLTGSSTEDLRGDWHDAGGGVYDLNVTSGFGDWGAEGTGRLIMNGPNAQQFEISGDTAGAPFYVSFGRTGYSRPQPSGDGFLLGLGLGLLLDSGGHHYRQPNYFYARPNYNFAPDRRRQQSYRSHNPVFNHAGNRSRPPVIINHGPIFTGNGHPANQGNNHFPRTPNGNVYNQPRNQPNSNFPGGRNENHDGNYRPGSPGVNIPRTPSGNGIRTNDNSNRGNDNRGNNIGGQPPLVRSGVAGHTMYQPAPNAAPIRENRAPQQPSKVAPPARSTVPRGPQTGGTQSGGTRSGGNQAGGNRGDGSQGRSDRSH